MTAALAQIASTSSFIPMKGLRAEDLTQVSCIASRIRERLPRNVELADLVNTGVVGMLEAQQRYDESKNVHFRAFAKFRIRGAIIDSLRDADWASRTLRRSERRIAEATARLEACLGHSPDESESAHEMHLEPDQLRKIVAQLDSLKVAGQTAIAFRDGAVLDVIESAPDLADPGPFELCQQRELNGFLAQAILKLSKREQLILSLYYREERSMKDIAGILGVALSRVSQIHREALTKLKKSLAYLREQPTECRQEM